MSKQHLEVRKHITDYVAKYVDKSCVVMMSSGVDSHSVLFSCMEAGIKPLITSFTLEDRESRDFLSAKHTAKTFGLKFRPIILSTDLTRIKKYCLAVAKVGATGKTSFECLWPFIQAFKPVTEDVLFTGYATDAFFALTKKGSMHYRHDVSTYAFEKLAWYTAPNSQIDILRRYARYLGFTYDIPWLSKEIYAQFEVYTYTYEDLNKPKQKQPIREQYADELKRCKVYNHTNAQLGDSGIAELFATLLKDPYWNKRKNKSVVAIYNAVCNGNIRTLVPEQRKGLLYEP
jgi:hypothetical protein